MKWNRLHALPKSQTVQFKYLGEAPMSLCLPDYWHANDARVKLFQVHMLNKPRPKYRIYFICCMVIISLEATVGKKDIREYWSLAD